MCHAWSASVNGVGTIDTCAIISLDPDSASHLTKSVPGSAKCGRRLGPWGFLGRTRASDLVDNCRGSEQLESLRCLCAQKLGNSPDCAASCSSALMRCKTPPPHGCLAEMILC